MQTLLRQERLSRQTLASIEPKFMELKRKVVGFVGDDGLMPPWLRFIYFTQNRFYSALYESTPGIATMNAAKLLLPFTDLCDVFLQEDTSDNNVPQQTD